MEDMGRNEWLSITKQQGCSVRSFGSKGSIKFVKVLKPSNCSKGSMCKEHAALPTLKSTLTYCTLFVSATVQNYLMGLPPCSNSHAPMPTDDNSWWCTAHLSSNSSWLVKIISPPWYKICQCPHLTEQLISIYCTAYTKSQHASHLHHCQQPTIHVSLYSQTYTCLLAISFVTPPSLTSSGGIISRGV